MYTYIDLQKMCAYVVIYCMCIYHCIPKYSIVRFVSTLPFQRRLTL